MLSRCRHGLIPVTRPQSTPSLRASAAINRYRRDRTRSNSNLAPGVSHDIAVLGGGVTGLATAYYITQQLPNARVTVYEAADRVGGWLHSTRVPVNGGSVLFESGPRTLTTPKNGILAVKLVEDLELADDLIITNNTAAAARSRFLYYPDHLVRMPHPAFGILRNAWSVATEPIFKTVLGSLLSEASVKPRSSTVHDESVGEFWSRRLGDTIVDRLLSGLIHGIYGGDPYELSAKSLFPAQWRDEVHCGSVLRGAFKASKEGLEVTKRDRDFYKEMITLPLDSTLTTAFASASVFTFKDGLGTLVDRLAQRLTESGQVTFKTATSITRLSAAPGISSVDVVTSRPQDGSTSTASHSHVVSALPPTALSTAVPDESLSDLLSGIRAATIMTVNLYYPTPHLHPPGFGYLIPSATTFDQNPERALGVVFDDAYGKDDQPLGALGRDLPAEARVQDDVPSPGGSKVTVMLGGRWWDGWPSYPDEQDGIEMAKSLLQRHLGITQEPEAVRASLRKHCIPQYVVGYQSRLNDIHEKLWHVFRGRLQVAGNWVRGVGVNDCLRSAWDIAAGLRRGAGLATGLEHVGATDYVRMQPLSYVGEGKDS